MIETLMRTEEKYEEEKERKESEQEYIPARAGKSDNSEGQYKFEHVSYQHLTYLDGT